jgi:hypothetical protein
MAECSQINNTSIIGTSAVKYDSTPLPCTNVNTCDGLNDILSKFDAVICSATDNVNSLLEEVTNITEDLMLITEDIINIQNQLDICCPICNFTGTANQILNCNFIGNANQLPDPTTTTTSTTIPPLFNCVAGQLIFDNDTSSSSIYEIYSTPNTWLITLSVPVNGGVISYGIQGGTSNPISVDVNLAPSDNPSCLHMYVNSVLIQSLSITSSGIYTFTPYVISNSDCVWFRLIQGPC